MGIKSFFYKVTSNGDFFYKNGLAGTEIIIPNKINNKLVYSISNESFPNKEKLRKIVLPESLHKIGNDTFKCCSNLKTITIPNTVSLLGNSAFEECINLNKIVLSSSLKTIKPRTFYNCIHLKNVELYDGIKIIGKEAFKNCESIERISLPNSITCIQAEAFKNCTNLKQITIPCNVHAIERDVFEGCNNLEILYGGTPIQWEHTVDITVKDYVINHSIPLLYTLIKDEPEKIEPEKSNIMDHIITNILNPNIVKIPEIAEEPKDFSFNIADYIDLSVIKDNKQAEYFINEIDKRVNQCIDLNKKIALLDIREKINKKYKDIHNSLIIEQYDR